MRNAIDSAKIKIVTVIFVSFVLVLLGGVGLWLLPAGKISYGNINGNSIAATSTEIATTTIEASSTPPAFVVTHISAPQTVKGVYFTSWAAGTPSFQKKMFELVDGSTEVN